MYDFVLDEHDMRALNDMETGSGITWYVRKGPLAASLLLTCLALPGIPPLRPEAHSSFPVPQFQHKVMPFDCVPEQCA